MNIYDGSEVQWWLPFDSWFAAKSMALWLEFELQKTSWQKCRLKLLKQDKWLLCGSISAHPNSHTSQYGTQNPSQSNNPSENKKWINSIVYGLSVAFVYNTI